jgi:hypothetical protein
VDADALPLLDGAALAWEHIHHAGFVALCREHDPEGTALHRVLLRLAADDARQVGHANGDALDCRRENLLLRTVQQRSRGARKMRQMTGRPCSSRFKGVTFDKQTGKWRAKIRVEGKSHSLGRYADEIAAAQAYDEAARRLFGKYGWLNFPDGVDAFLEQEAAAGQRSAAA